MRIKMKTGAVVDTDTLATAEVALLKLTLESQIGEIVHQIDEAKAVALETGEYANPHWFANAKLALRLHRRDAQRLQEELAQRRRADKLAAHTKKEPRIILADFFVDVCREKMDHAVFDAVMAEARRRFERAGAARDAARQAAGA